MNKYLIKLANHLDKKGLHKEADYIDWILKKADFYAPEDATSFGERYVQAEFKMPLRELEKMPELAKITEELRYDLEGIPSFDFNSNSREYEIDLSLSFGHECIDPQNHIAELNKKVKARVSIPLEKLEYKELYYPEDLDPYDFADPNYSSTIEVIMDYEEQEELFNKLLERGVLSYYPLACQQG